MKKHIGRFHVLTDYHFQQQYSHAEIATLAIDGGADAIQFRQKTGGIRHITEEAVRASMVCRERSVAFIVNDRIDVALACEADGVHLGQSDMRISAARRILGDSFIIGATAATLNQALRAVDEGADYIGFGPVFPTRSKRNPASVKGLAKLAQVCEKVEIPIIAIAGITRSRVADVIGAGAYGVAVMTAVTTSDDPASAAWQIRSALDEAVTSSSVAAASNGQSQRLG